MATTLWLHDHRIDVLNLFGRFGRGQRISLRDPNAAGTFVASVKEDVKAARDNDMLLPSANHPPDEG
jgi:hypothetical protein